jgi:putative FmdB family regulatory protein|tara:strand:+ start:148 stop:492 length:345 start_codon:yes stop_codon:yes gene_type:complete
MPIYEYLCKSCGHEFEEVQKFSDPSLEECPDCGQNTAERQVSMSSFHLKGGGWYKDGYSNKKSDSEKSEKDTSSSTTKETSTSEKSTTDKLSKSEKKESTSNKNPKNTSKEKAA